MAKSKKEIEAEVADTVVNMGGAAKLNLKRFSVALKHHATMTVEAQNEADALKAYYDANGIIQSDHQANIVEVASE